MMAPHYEKSALGGSSGMRILPYSSRPAEFHPYDSEVVGIVSLLGDAIRSVESQLQVEHVGSTSVPGCGGKGVIDLAVLYPEGLLSRARVVLDDLGFQKQGGPEPFPEERPMRVGCVEHSGHSYWIHAHVIALDSAEHRELVWFRQTLRRDSSLRRKYEERKRAILAMGIRDSLQYCKAKGAFIADVLKGRNVQADISAARGNGAMTLSPRVRPRRRVVAARNR
jgi:GrpB-like predicted nucleotidyltransferase (UPF0157 family)